MEKPGTYIRKGANAYIITLSFIPYTNSLIGSQMTPRKRRIVNIFSRCEERSNMNINLEKGKKSFKEAGKIGGTLRVLS